MTKIRDRVRVEDHRQDESTRKQGIDSRASTMRIMNESTGPPTNPANAPHSVPMRIARTAAANPTSSEVWPPTISLPSWS